MNTESLAQQQEAKSYPIEFRGEGSDYFRIWIVNLFLTIITLGIYSAWATVRTRRYLYTHTYLDTFNFDYLGEPKAILRARIVAVALLSIIIFTQNINPFVGSIVFLVGLILYPWIINRAWNFQLRNTEYRNLRFEFKISNNKVYLLQLPILIPFIALVLYVWWYVSSNNLSQENFGDTVNNDRVASAIIFAIVFSIPLFFMATRYATKRHLTRSSSYGVHPFSCDLKVKKMLSYLVFSVILLLVPFVLSSLFVLSLDYNKSTENFLLSMLFITIAQFATAFYHVKTQNYWINTTYLSDLKLKANLEVLPYFYIVVTNLLFNILTLGIYYSFSVIRRHRYIVSHIAVIAEDLDHYKGNVFNETRALGEELTDVFGIEIGF